MSQNTPATPDTPRVPHAVQGVDVNFCRNPKCSNFGVPIPQSAQKGRGSLNSYTVVAKGKNIPAARCNDCGEIITLKSNSGVLEESRRILAAHFPHPSCPEPLCANHRVPVHVKGAYHAIGTTRLGSRRYRCLECKGSFSVKPEGINPIRNQRQSDKNRTILSLLTNKMPLRRICEVADVSPRVLYDRIDFLSSQAEAFLADREKGFPETDFNRLYVGTDRQVYVSNWTRREDIGSDTLVKSHVRDGDPHDPLFRLNHVCAKIRADLACMARDTWTTTKKIECLQDRLDIYIAWNNGYSI